MSLLVAVYRAHVSRQTLSVTEGAVAGAAFERDRLLMRSYYYYYYHYY